MSIRREHAPPDFLPWVATLVHRHRAELLRFARRRGLAAEDALDAVQDTFLVFLDLADARSIAHAGNDAVKLLTVLLRHQILNRRRKGARRAARLAELGRERDLAHEDSSQELIEAAEEAARVRGCILRMAELQRAVIELSLVDGKPHEEIGKLLGITPGHARVLLHRAREHVRHCAYDERPAAPSAPAPRARRPRARRAKRQA